MKQPIKITNEEIKKYPIYLLNTQGKLIRIYWIKSKDDYDHNKHVLHHYIKYQSFVKNQKWYEEQGIQQKLIFISHICHEHIHDIGIKQLTDEEFEKKYKISKWKLIYNRKYTEERK